MPDPIEDLEGFTMPTVTPIPAADVRRRGDRIRRRNNALAAVGGVAAVAALAVPFAIFAGNQGSSAPQPAVPSPTVAWVQSVPDTFDLGVGLPDATVQDGYDRQAAEACEDAGWSPQTQPAPVDLQQAIQQESEGGWDRTLAVYADDEAASRAYTTVSARVNQCAAATAGDTPSTEVIGDSDSLVYVDHLDDAGSMYANRVVQVGNALLVESAFSMGGGDPDVVHHAIQLFEEKSAGVVDQMCVFSAAGCGGGDTAEDSTIGEGAVPAIPDDFPLEQGLPAGGRDITVDAPDPTASCEHAARKPKAVETGHAQWSTISQIRDRQLLTFSSQADAQAYVEAVSTTDCSPNRVSVVSTDASGALITVGHNENAGTVDPGLVETYVVRVGRAVLLAQRIDEGYTWGGDVEAEGETLAEDLSSELAPLVTAMCTFTETGC